MNEVLDNTTIAYPNEAVGRFPLLSAPSEHTIRIRCRSRGFVASVVVMVVFLALGCKPAVSRRLVVMLSPGEEFYVGGAEFENATGVLKVTAPSNGPVYLFFTQARQLEDSAGSSSGRPPVDVSLRLEPSIEVSQHVELHTTINEVITTRAGVTKNYRAYNYCFIFSSFKATPRYISVNGRRFKCEILKRSQLGSWWLSGILRTNTLTPE
jgi:hypothetical protein